MARAIGRRAHLVSIAAGTEYAVEAAHCAPVGHVVRSGDETAHNHLKRRTEVPPVSRSYLQVFNLHFFKQM
ncbi:MAG TPA: hypothetical protein VF798_16055 [Burkholderiaceae bacterium]